MRWLWREVKAAVKLYFEPVTGLFARKYRPVGKW
jgi:hypothetical protein